MRKLLFILTLLTVTLCQAGKDEKPSDKEGGYGTMKEIKEEKTEIPREKKYIVGILVTGDSLRIDSLTKFELLEKHVDYMKRLNAKGQLFASGPLTTSDKYRGLYIFNVKSIESARALMMKDKAVQLGFIRFEFHEWRTRNYEISSSSAGEYFEDETNYKNWQFIALIIFVLIIIILMLRTFRGKAEV